MSHEPNHNGPVDPKLEDGVLQDVLDRLGISVSDLTERERDHIEGLLDRVMTEMHGDEKGESADDYPTGQKTMSDDTDRLAERIVDSAQEQAREKSDEAARDQKGNLKHPTRDRQNKVSDDRGNRKRRSKGLDPTTARQKLRELEEDAVDARGKRPHEDDDGDKGDVDPRISESAGGEGW